LGFGSNYFPLRLELSIECAIFPLFDCLIGNIRMQRGDDNGAFKQRGTNGI
jgi:hypothetical protein